MKKEPQRWDIGGRKYRLCEKCQIEKIPVGRQRYCGSYKTQTGCSYLNKLERRRGPHWQAFKLAHPDYWRKQEERRNKERRIQKLASFMKYYGLIEFENMLKKARELNPTTT